MAVLGKHSLLRGEGECTIALRILLRLLPVHLVVLPGDVEAIADGRVLIVKGRGHGLDVSGRHLARKLAGFRLGLDFVLFCWDVPRVLV